MASWLSGKSVPAEGSAPSSPTVPKSVPPPSKPKKRERWLMTRKTWRYMADAGRHLIPEALRKGKDMKDYTDEDFVKLDDRFQEVCDSEREFIEWEGPLEDPRVLLAKNRQPRAKNTEEEEVVDYRYESLSAKFRLILPSGQTPPPGYVQVGTRRLPVGDKHHPGDPSSSHSAEEAHNKYLRLPSGLIIQELPSAFLTESDWARRCSSPSPPDSGVLSPDLADLDYDEDEGDDGRLGESGIGSGADSVKSKFKTMCVQTEPLPEEFYKIRDEEIRRKEEEERLAREAEERAQELEASMMGDSVMRYLKMVRRNSKNADTKKAERFRSMNYDPTLRNIKAKYLYKDDEITTKTVEVQCDDSILHLLKQCETPVDSLPYFWDRRMSQASSSPGAVSPPMRRFSGDKDFYSHLYSGDLSGIEGGSIPEDYYHYLESWYRAQKAQGGAKPPPGPGIYIPVSTLQNLRSSMPTLSSTAASTCMVSRSTTSLSGHSTSSPKSLFSSVLGKSTSSISKKLRPHGRSKSQSISSISTSSWCPQSDHRWNHSSNKSVQLEDTNVLLLHELERVALQKLSVQKLNASDLGVSLRIPKDSTDTKPKRRNNFIKKRVLSSAKRERDKPPNPTFGLPLSQCVPEASLPPATGSRPSRKRSSTVEPFTSISDDPPQARASRSGSRTSFGSLVLDKISSPHQSIGSCESLTFDFHRVGEASLSSAAEDLVPSVPKIVIDCIRHIEQYGLHTVGIFRVSSSKKRVRQLRESFEAGQEVILTEETSVHDVGTLLKEFFRDLPEPIIPVELLTALIAVTQVKNKPEQIHYLQRLMHVLPLPNRDTLFILLQFLGLVAENAEDKIGENGEVLLGNKMDSANLATLFAPNLLHSFKIDEKQAGGPGARGDSSNDYISVTKLLIDSREAIFDIPVEQLHDLYVYLSENFPDLLDALLKRRLMLLSGEECAEDEKGDDEHGGPSVENLAPLCSSPPVIPCLQQPPERGRTRRRKTSTGSSSVERHFKTPPPHPTASPPKDADFHRWTFNLKSFRGSSAPSDGITPPPPPVSRGSIKFSTPEGGPPRGCMTTNTTTTISPASRSGDAFFGSGTSTPSGTTEPGSPLCFSPPLSPPPLCTTQISGSPVSDVLLVLNPVPPRSRKKTPTGSSSPPTIVEEEPPPSTPRRSLTPFLPPDPGDRRAKTDNLDTFIKEIERLPTVASDSCLASASKREVKRYTRRRYTDSRHPTKELPDVRLEVANEMSVRKPPVRKTHLTVEKP